MSAAPALSPPPGNPRFPLLDSLRGASALCVFLVHAAVFSRALVTAWYGKWVARLDIGVTTFFVISGFLLFRPFVAARLNGVPRPSIARYARKRVLRIVPAYWLALTILTVHILGVGHLLDGRSLANYLFLQQYVTTPPIIPQGWTLNVDAGYYLALPLIVLAIGASAFGRDRRSVGRRTLLLLAALYLGSFAFLLIAGGGAPPTHVLYDPVGGNAAFTVAPHTAFSGIFGLFNWFALGMALALASAVVEGRERQPLPVRLVERFPSLCWLLAAALFLGSPLLGIIPTFPTRYSGPQWFAAQAIYGVIAVLLLLPAVFGERRAELPRRILRNRALAWLGLVSYGFYLWHLWILTELAKHPPPGFESSGMLVLCTLGLGLALLLGAASYYLVERPALRYKYRRRRPRKPTRVPTAA